MKQFQVTLYSTLGYRPVSAIVTLEDNALKSDIQRKGIERICVKRLWNKVQLKQYGYTKCKTREYNKEDIERQNRERYERIKEEKYKTGEWKRPTH